MNQKISALLMMVILSVAGSGCDSPKNEDAAQNTSQTATSGSAAAQTETAKVTAMPVQAASPLLGSYVGYFVAVKMDQKKYPMYKNKINLSIDLIKDGQIAGHSVVAGNKRPFTGTYTETATGELKAQVKEPGDDPYDGAFTFTVKGNQVTGSWTANDKKLSVTTRSYDLKKAVFKYNPQQKFEAESYQIYNASKSNKDELEYITEDSMQFNASTTLLTSKDVENMYKRDLEVIRNTIYARHGYSFQNREMRDFFDKLAWYIPVSTDITQDLSELEIKNIALLKRYEKHAESYYDSFGR